MASYMNTLYYEYFSDLIPQEPFSLPMTSLQIKTKNDVKYFNVKLYNQEPSNRTQTA